MDSEVTRQVLLSAALLGFHGAKGRHDAARLENDVVGLLVPLNECAYWACLLEEQVWKVPKYRERRDADWNGAVLPGLRLARGLSTHQLPLTVEYASGFAVPMSVPLATFEFKWRPFEELPPVPDEKRGKYVEAQETSYRDRLAGTPTRLTIESVAQWFGHEQNVPGSPLNFQS
jgi:hypothetical protein